MAEKDQTEDTRIEDQQNEKASLVALKEPAMPDIARLPNTLSKSQKQEKMSRSHVAKHPSRNFDKNDSMKEKEAEKGQFSNSMRAGNSSGLLLRTMKEELSKMNNKNLQKKNKFELSVDDFQIGSKLGRGSYGTVYIARHKTTGFICALKKIQKKAITDKNMAEQLTREIKIQSFLDHQNITKLYTYFHDSTYLYLILELACGGHVYSLLKDRKKFTEKQAAQIVLQTSEAVRYLHSFKIIHRDIKPQNLVLNYNVVKLCDFGWAVFRGSSLRSTICGTPLFASPEILQGHLYDEKVDIWAVGILAYELMVGQTPFQVNNSDQLIRIVRDDVEFPPDSQVSKLAQDFILRILTKNPSKRLDINQIMAHPFLLCTKH